MKALANIILMVAALSAIAAIVCRVRLAPIVGLEAGTTCMLPIPLYFL